MDSFIKGDKMDSFIKGDKMDSFIKGDKMDSFIKQKRSGREINNLNLEGIRNAYHIDGVHGHWKGTIADVHKLLGREVASKHRHQGDVINEFDICEFILHELVTPHSRPFDGERNRLNQYRDTVTHNNELWEHMLNGLMYEVKTWGMNVDERLAYDLQQLIPRTRPQILHSPQVSIANIPSDMLYDLVGASDIIQSTEYGDEGFILNDTRAWEEDNNSPAWLMAIVKNINEVYSPDTGWGATLWMS